MTLNPILPQATWVGPLTSDNIFGSESQFRIHPQIGFFVLCCQGFSDCPFQSANFWAGEVSQQRSQRTMADQHWLQHMAEDSGDEACTTEDIYSHCYALPGPSSTTYDTDQTNAVDVSGVSGGRNFGLGPGPAQQNKPPGNEPMFLPNLRTANGYSLGFGANYDAHQYSWQAYNNTAPNPIRIANYLDFPNGLPSTQWSDNEPVFGEPLEGPRVSPSSFSSSIPSSATSDALAAMTLDPITGQNNTIGTPHANSAAPPSSETDASSWVSGYSSTVSPKMLRLNPSPAHTSSSESMQSSILVMTDPDVGPSNIDHHPSSPLPVRSHAPKSRKELPTKSKKSRSSPEVSLFSSKSKGKKREVSILPSISHQRALPNLRGVSEDAHEQVYEVPEDINEEMQEEIDEEAPEDDIQEDEPLDLELTDIPVARPSRKGKSKKKKVTELTEEAKRRAEEARAAKDEFLVKSKKEGLTYREIRKRGNFTEAESTLRGRFRALTKEKEARVRKPEWRENDIVLLKKAVRKICRGEDAKAPWGQVSEYIVKNGGSYHFSGGTCHKNGIRVLGFGLGLYNMDGPTKVCVLGFGIRDVEYGNEWM
ncbi:hypothetical protein F5B19DRAFT_487197 [Rostrohypoxylon terebratum]|nr:hypothetical protein F5B19DRAFT_487197 [Rostrohypoxylon terebratum]